MAYEEYLYFDKAIPIENFELRPIIMSEYPRFMWLSSVLTIDIYSIPDPKILKMKYLEYLMEYNSSENGYMAMLVNLLSMCLDIDVNRFGWLKEESLLVIIENEDNVENGHRIIDPKLFETMRFLIAEQNNIPIPNYKIDKRIRESQEEARRLRAEIDGKEPTTIEEYMVSVAGATGVPFKDIYNMSVRKFFMLLERLDLEKHYDIYKAAQVSGFVKFKNESAIKHWLSHIIRDEFDELMALSELEGKASGKS